MKKYLLVVLLGVCSLSVTGQEPDEEKEQKNEEEKGGFKKENLFTGGSISAGFSNRSFLIGASPMLGYSINNWIDAGLVFNYTYSSYRDYIYFDDKLRQTVFGGGPFLKIYPVRFLFIQGQLEQNFLKNKLIYADGTTYKSNDDVTSFLVGAGYTTGRYGKGGPPFFYISILFDVLGDNQSPYTDGYGRIIPNVRGGLQVPLFQGGDGKRPRRGGF